ncbi:VCBS repeat-containing protein [Algoriphagus hitonicola]|uniref:Repeat domain-containing protein n=1 Tax=Algoriphagus hitonicola TaxID=435880 RepID=A0A1I2SD29_9BACT|nr:VCBS repeat-containing protein [Algoriphagus hitonicola]SFG50762.1 Repeat domain-containing protein [Algoriphagus hitonicola]
MRRITTSFYCVLIVLLISCQKSAPEKKSRPETSSNALFQLVEPKVSGVTFINRIEESLNLNVLMYEYLYNGAGVAVGDLNGDGLDDLYFSANVSGPKLYLNQGNLKFKDITETANVQGIPGPWNTGVVFADVNGDGLLDIYQCRSGALPPEKRKNLLFINQGPDESGIPIFEEKGAEFGIDSSSPSTSASFFDFDRDGDLDLFLLNHNTRSIQNQDVSRTIKLLKEKNEAGSQLFENRNGVFVEVTSEAGISSSVFSYGLGISTVDVNMDGWPDIYIGNDYAMPDYLYINQKDGTFKDEIGQRLGHISNFSMGNDIADVNNDGLPDIFTLDMLPEDNYRQKLLMAPDNYEVFQLNLDKGWHHQYMRNMLHVNDGTGKFQEVGQFSGISNTDWSWSALFADFDNDGWKDLFVSNGYLRDYNNQDFLMYMENYVQTSGGNLKREDLLDLVKTMPSTGISNYVFRNNQNLQFENKTQDWGLDIPLTSNGSAYADLDNDGDLDLIVNNINSPASIFENKSNELQAQNYLKIKLTGEKKNPFAIGTQVSAYSGNAIQYLEQNPYRGFQSSVSPVLHLGLGEGRSIDSLVISWPDGSEKILRSVSANQTLEIDSNTGDDYQGKAKENTPILSKTFEVGLKKGVQSNDFKRQPMLLHPISNQQQAWTVADFDQDGHPDLFVGGERGVSGGILYHLTSPQPKTPDTSSFKGDSPAEDSDAVAFDANGDGKTDLLVAGGGLHQFQSGDKEWEPRLYLNQGNKRFTRSENAFDGFSSPVSKILVHDFNGDGAEDVLLASRLTPDQYPLSPGAQIWISDGKGKFTEETQKYAPELFELGMITDGVFVDLDQDGSDELILVGEAMPISIFEINGKQWEKATERYFETPLIGFWNHIQSADWDQNGNVELIVGNIGKNTQLRASLEKPMELLFRDFDGNGSMDAIYGYPIQGEVYPLVSRGELLAQMPLLKKRYLDFKSYASLKFEDLFSPSERSDAELIQINELETVYLKINSLGKFEQKPLPQEVQYSPVFASHATDINDDGKLDLILGGNMDFGKISIGKYDASRGLILLGDGAGEFQPLSPDESGVSILGDTRGITTVEDYLIWIEKSKAVHIYNKNQAPN